VAKAHEVMSFSPTNVDWIDNRGIGCFTFIFLKQFEVKLTPFRFKIFIMAKEWQ